MHIYRVAGESFWFFHAIAELCSCEIKSLADEKVFPRDFPPFQNDEVVELFSRTEGWVGSAQRIVEVYNALRGILLKVEGGGEFFISQPGEVIGKLNADEELSQLDREIILGPVIVLALALRNVWSLHASAVMYNGKTILFLGESGRGKSTLASYLSQHNGWRLVADDILPAKMDGGTINILPHFPQLKLPLHTQPGVGLPEELPLNQICVLEQAEPGDLPALHKGATAYGVQSLLSHIAGTRMFNVALLAKHLEFSTQAAAKISVHRLIHPHRRDTLPLVRQFLENLC